MFQGRNFNDNQGSIFQSFKIRILILLMLFFTAFAGYHFLKTKQKQVKIDKEILELQEQIDEYENKNMKLEELANYLQTDDFKEKEAKQKLNLVKEGEKVVIVKKSEIEKTVDSFEEKKPEIEISRPNYYYWWQYFFGIKPETSSTNSLQEN